MKVGFKSVILVLFSLLLVITVSVVALNSYYQARSGVIDLSSRIIDSTVDQMLLRINNLVELTGNRLSMLAIVVQDKDLMAQHEEVMTLLWTLNQRSPFYRASYIADRHGNFLQARKQPYQVTRINYFSQANGYEEWIYRAPDYQPLARVTKALEYNPHDWPWYQAVSTTPKPHWSDVYTLQDGEGLGITISYPILDDDGQLKGVAGIDIGLADLNQFLSESRLGHLFIINGAEEVLAHSQNLALRSTQRDESILKLAHINPPWIAQAWEAVQAQLNTAPSSGGAVLNLTLDGKRYFIKASQLTRGFNQDWYLLGIVPDYEVLATINRGLYTSLMLALILLIVATYIVYVIANQLTRPLQQVVANTDLMEQLRFNELKPVNAPFNEFRRLDSSIKNMSRSLVAFNRYVPTALIRQLLHTQHEAKLGGEARPLILMNSEVTELKRHSRGMQTQQKITYLTRYQNEMFQTVAQHSGIIDKFIDDRIIAFWGAPFADPQDARKACTAALDALKAVQTLNRSWREQQFPEMAIRIGLHTDECIVGNFGSDEYMFYSVLGDGVAISHWLERLNKRYGTQIIISDVLYAQVSRDFCFRWLDQIDMRRQNDQRATMKIYELVGPLPEGVLAAPCQEYINRYEAALTLRYIDHKPQAALEKCLALQESYPQDAAVAWQIQTLQEQLSQASEASL